MNKCTERASQKPSKDPEASSQPGNETGSEEGAGTQLEEAGMRGPKSRGPS